MKGPAAGKETSATSDRDLGASPLDASAYVEDLTEPGEEPIENLDSPDDVVPFKYSITSYGADYPIDGLVKRLKEGDVFIPKFQRAYVWDTKRASNFVESLLLGLPVPGIFLSREEDTSRLLVIDGQQRLKTIQYFYAGEFPDGKPFALDAVQSEFKGATYEGLDASDRRRLDDSILHATVVRQDVPTEDNSSIYHIFARLNTGGLQLTQQEIRACIYHGPFNEHLATLNLNESWRRSYGPVNKRMRDQELILRFLAFFYRPKDFETSLKEFLNKFMGQNRNLGKFPADALDKAFVPTIELFDTAIGREAFRPRLYINAAVFDSAMVGLATALAGGGKYTAATVKSRYRLLLRNRTYRDATEVATNAADAVKTRLSLAIEAFESN